MRMSVVDCYMKLSDIMVCSVSVSPSFLKVVCTESFSVGVVIFSPRSTSSIGFKYEA